MLIYISGPYTASTKEGCEKNTYDAIDAAIEVNKKGHLAFVPHLSHWHDLRAKDRGVEIPWQHWIEVDLRLLIACDALLYLKPSKGADIELAKAKEIGMQIFYSVAEVGEVIN